jgi:hypothetical protein
MLPLLVAIAASASSPKVAGPPVVAVFAKADDQVAERASGKLEVDLTAALKKRGVKTPDLDALFPPPKEPTEEGDTLVAAGKEAYDNLDLDGAIGKLTDAALFFVKHPALTQPKKLAEIFLFLASAELQNGDKQNGKDFQRAAVLGPDLKPDPKLFGADVQKAFNAAKAEVAKTHGVVLIESVPSGATIEVNGKKVGLSPLSAMELPQGRNHARASRPGYVAAGAFPEVKASEDTDVKLTLQPVPAYQTWVDLANKFIGRAGFDQQKLPQAASSLASAMNARYLVLLNVSTVRGIASEAEAQVWDTETGNRLRELKFVVDDASIDKTADTIHRWIDRPAPVEVVEAQPSSGSGVLQQPWIWVVAGVVVVGAAATGVGVAVTQHHHGYDFTTGIP